MEESDGQLDGRLIIAVVDKVGGNLARLLGLHKQPPHVYKPDPRPLFSPPHTILRLSRHCLTVGNESKSCQSRSSRVWLRLGVGLSARHRPVARLDGVVVVPSRRVVAYTRL